MTFSISIPTYEMRGRGARFLNELLDSIERQTFQDFEVIVSDHSKDDAVREACRKRQKNNKIKYIRNAENRGDIFANLHNAVSAAEGDIVKPMDQDDFFRDSDCLKKIFDAVEAADGSKFSWGIVGFAHTNEHADSFFDSSVSPHPDTRMAGIPRSTIFYMNKKTGTKPHAKVGTAPPLVVPGELVAIRIWPFQASMYRTLRDLDAEERRRMHWLSFKHMVRKYVLNPLEKISKNKNQSTT